MQHPPNNSTSSYNRTGNGPVPSSASQDLGGPSNDNMAGSNGDQYFSATFNAMGIQDFPPFLSGAARSRPAIVGGVGKPFPSPSSGVDHTADDFAALNLAVGPQNKAPNSTNDFGPKSPGLPHSSSTSSFVSYASMFGQQPTPSTHSTMTHTNMYGQSLAPINSSTAPPATMFNPPAPAPSASTQNSISRGSLYATEPPSIHSSTPASNVSQMGPPSTSVDGLVYSSAISPSHSPRMSPSSSPLAARRRHSPANQGRQSSLVKSAAPSLVQESVGGTTYFYSPEEFKPQNDGPHVTFPAFSAYPGMPSFMVHLKLKSSVPQYFAADELKMEILNRHVLAMSHIDPSSPLAADIPAEVDNYQSLCPLERTGPPKPSLANLPSTTYKAISTRDGLHYCLKRIHGFRLANTKVNSIIESWKKLYHPNVVQLKEVFTTKAFNDNSIVFVYDYHSGAETMMSQYFSSQTHVNGYNHHQNHHHHHPHHFSRDHGKNNSPRNMNNNLLAEGLIWTYIVQLSSSLRAIHSAGLAVRSLDPSRIIITGKSRLRINCTGILDIITPENSGQSNSAAYQQDDLTAMGKIILALSCNNLMSVQRESIQSSIELVQRNYSPDLKNLLCYLLQNPSRIRSINDVMPMIGARFFTQLDSSQLRSDVIENELAKEIENGRLFRIMVKLGSINERPEYNSEPSWAETGDRFMLKLFRDYLFHQVDEQGLPWIDMSHIIQSLNKFDAGVPEKICLVSRDENCMLVVSYSELKRCFQSCFQVLVAQADQSAAFS